MGIDRKTYQRQLSGAGFPGVESPQFSTQAEMFSDISKKLNVIKDFVIETGTEQAVDRGKAFGVSNPVNVADFLNADSVTREKFLSTGPTAFDKAVDAVRINLLTTDIEAASTASINDLLDKAKKSIGTEDEPSSESMSALLFGIVDGAKSALEADPEASLTLYSSLSTKANAAYKDYLDNVYTSAVAELKATAISRGQLIVESLPSFVGQDIRADYDMMGAGFNLSELGFEKNNLENTMLPWERQVEFVIEQGVNQLKSSGATGPQINTFITNATAAVSTAASEKLYTNYYINDQYNDESLSLLGNAIKSQREIEQGDFSSTEKSQIWQKDYTTR